MTKNKFGATSWVLFFLFIISYLLFNSFGYLDNDLGWHLKVGEEIWKNRSVPGYDNYNYTLAGQKWVDHEWLINLISYLVYSNFGYGLLTFLFAFLGLVVFLLIAIFLKREFFKDLPGANAMIMTLVFIGLMGMRPHLGVRMQEVTMLLFTLLLIIIYFYNKHGHYRILFWLLPLFYLWANMHGGFLIGLVILFLWLIVKGGEKILAKYSIFKIFNLDQIASYKKLGIFFIFSLLSLVVTLFTPYGFKLYAFLSDYTNTYYQKAIEEWLPFYYLPIQYWQIIYAAIVSTFCLIFIIFALKKQRDEKGEIIRLDVWRLVLSIIFLILALKSKRHFPLFFIAAAFFIADFCRYFFVIPEKLSSLYRGNIFIRTYFIFAMLFLIATYSLKINYVADPFDPQGQYCSGYPCLALESIKQDPRYEQLKLFSSYDWGGYLIWTWPEKKLFIDGRLPQYPYQGRTLLEEYHDFFYEDTLAAKLKSNDIQMVFLKKPVPLHVSWIEKFFLSYNEEELNRRIQDNKLIKYLEENQEWKNIYIDDIALVYIKT